MDWSRVYGKYKRDLREAETEFELLRFIGKMLIEIWWNTTK